MKSKHTVSFILLLLLLTPNFAHSESEYTVFDDKMLLDGYAKKYADESKETLLEMIKDDTLTPYMSAAGIRVFRESFSREVFASEKNVIEKILLRRLNKSDSTFVDIEAMHTLCLMDRYKYFESMVPVMIQLLDHYNSAVNELAFNGVQDILASGPKRSREARIVFNTLRKTLFLSRKRLINVKEPDARLKQKLSLLRWAIKILGTEELKRLPSEVIPLL